MTDRIPILSVTRPWPKLILERGKDIENRTWETPYRGPLWIHAAASWDTNAEMFARERGVAVCTYRDGHPRGIVGQVDLTSISVPTDGGPCLCGPWAVPGQYHWHLANPRGLAAPIPARGRLGLWWPTGELLEQLTAARFVEVAG